MVFPRRSTAIAAIFALCFCLFGCSSAVSSSGAPQSPTPTSPPLPLHPRIFFFGDSFTHGTAATPGRGFPQVVGAALEGTVELGPDNSGSGFVHSYVPTHPLLGDAAADLKQVDADVVVLQAGVNDQPGPLDRFWPAVERTVHILREKAPGARIVMIGPVMPDGSTSEALTVIDAQEADLARALSIVYVSPLREHWFTRATSGLFLDVPSGHPNTAGHAYYGGRVASVLESLQAR